MPEQEDLSEIQSAIREMTPQDKFAHDAVGYSSGGLQYESPQVAKGWGKNAYRDVLREFLEGDPIRMWLFQHSPVAHMIISRAAMKVVSEGGEAIDPVDIANEFERQRREQDSNWRAFTEGAVE